MHFSGKSCLECHSSYGPLISFSIPEQQEPPPAAGLTDSREGQVQADTAPVTHKVLHKSADTALGGRDPDSQPAANMDFGDWRASADFILSWSFQHLLTA